MIDGLVDADLGGGVLKKRVALPGRGKRGGARTLVATKRGAQLEALQGLAMELLALSSQQLNIAVEDGGLLEISRDP